MIAEQKKFQGASNEEDTLDAFVALGGESNKEGSIDAAELIRIIKHEFEMTIDIEKLIEDIDEDGSGQIEYDEFMSLLSSSDWIKHMHSLSYFTATFSKKACLHLDSQI